MNLNTKNTFIEEEIALLNVVTWWKVFHWNQLILNSNMLPLTTKDQNHRKLVPCYICHWKWSILQEMQIILLNKSNYNFLLIIKHSGPNSNKKCIWLLYPPPFPETSIQIFFVVKHLNKGWRNFKFPFFECHF